MRAPGQKAEERVRELESRLADLQVLTQDTAAEWERGRMRGAQLPGNPSGEQDGRKVGEREWRGTPFCAGVCTRSRIFPSQATGIRTVLRPEREKEERS